MDFYDEFGDYDPVMHMCEDPVDFQMRGYGGFGYDTSHVPPDEKHGPLYTAAKDGNLSKVKSLVEKDPKVEVLNQTRSWTEVDYRMSGFTKEYQWFDLTPLAIAANQGQANVTHYLLEKGADPTLKGCPDENVHYTALGAAEQGFQKFQNKLDRLRTIKQQTPTYELYGYDAFCSTDNESVQDTARRILERKLGHGKSVALLKAVEPFWNTASYAHSRYCSQRSDANYNNRPTNNEAMLQALQLASNTYDGEKNISQQEIDALVPCITILNELSRKKKAEEEARKKKANKKPAGKGHHKRQKKSKKNATQTQQNRGDGEPRQNRKLCRFFPQGTCRYGENCRFSHDQPNP